MEVFHEDILETFIFCFLASLGIIQVMAARRGWHGLSLYGGRLHRGVNYALGAALLIFSYAWYFSDPLHRNVRNLAAFMSLVCLLLGVLAAFAATAAAASLSESLRRLFRSRPGEGARTGGKAAGEPVELPLPAAKVLLSPAWEKARRKLVLFAEPGRGGERLARRLLPNLPQDMGYLSIHPRGESGGGDPEGPERVSPFLEVLRELEGEEGMDLRRADFLGLGWGGNELLRLRSSLERSCRPRRFLSVAPVVPDPGRAILGDALLSNTPWDILCRLADEKPWREKPSRILLRLWAPLCLACAAAGVVLTAFFDIRWKVFSGLAGGSVASTWLAYFFATRRGIAGHGINREERKARSLFWEHLHPGECPLEVVICGGDAQLLRARFPQHGNPQDGMRFHVFTSSLRGKFFLDRRNAARLLELLAEES